MEKSKVVNIYEIKDDRLAIRCYNPTYLFGSWFSRPTITGKTQIYNEMSLRHLNVSNSNVIADIESKRMYV